MSLTISLRLRADWSDPGIVAERLPKALIHRNVPGERIHRLLTELDEARARQAPHAAYGEAAVHRDGRGTTGCGVAQRRTRTLAGR